jgi:catechol 2,3-dioxygenase-like lactoylglutathione lyase family enzyme
MQHRENDMLDHMGFGVSDLRRSRAFYEEALAPLGIAIVRDVPERDAMGFGAAGKPFFWIAKAEGLKGHLHVAFVTESRAAVDAFHRAALAAGGTDNGAPGLRAHYHPNYYGAFVLDPDGNNIEAVCHRPE